ncbi:MAG: hypothetical protein JXB05_03225 [Myxococcaceae bacterium]|nr:hypothetical protein [Myxococcaceae bacterium]
MRLATLWSPIILLSLAGCGEGDEVKIEKGPFITVNREMLEFNQEFYSGTYVGASSFDSLYIENRGDKTLEITKITKSGSGAFTVTLPEELTQGNTVKLETLQKAYIQAQFRPTAAQEYTGTLTIESNAENMAEKQITLKATGVPAP